ncbi:MAG: DUF4412 domain-containing protein [Calditrichia bacterium]
MRFTQIISFMILLLLSSLALSAAAKDFEGVVTQRQIYVSLIDLDHTLDFSDMETVAEKWFSKSVDELRNAAKNSQDPDVYEESQMTITVKGNKMRIDTQEDNQTVSAIYDSENQQVITLQHDQKMAMVTNLNDMKNMAQSFTGQMGGSEGTDQEDDDAEEESQFSMQKTGDTRTINGYKATLYKGTDDDGDYSYLWITDDDAGLLGVFTGLMQMMDQEEESAEDKELAFFKGISGFPVLTKSLSESDLNIMELVKVEEKNVSGDLFKVPADYQQMDMQQMMQQQMQKFQQEMKKMQDQMDDGE